MPINGCIVLLLFCSLLACPGLLVKKYLRSIAGLSAFIFSTAVSLAFWICVTWYISLVNAPLDISFFILLGLLLLVTLFSYRSQLASFSVKGFIAFAKRQPLSRIVLLVMVVLYLFPYALMSIPPGADITMHGYITRLIINNNGLPYTYDPIIPDSPFGSYSAGYQALTAMLCGVHLPMMKAAINMMSVGVYPVALLALVFLYRQFVSERMAIYAGIITFMINSSLQSTIGWGGNPTILAFAFCMICIGAVIHAARTLDVFVFRCSALLLAAIPLVHAIPAVTFIYISVPAFVLLLWFYHQHWRWVITHSIAMGILAIVLLVPFILHFQNENSPALLSLIKRWQIDMMHHTLADTLWGNIIGVSTEIMVRTGDPLVIAFVVSMVCLLLYKLYKEAAIISGFAVVIFLLILNYAYWVIPFSEILYPERVAFFMIALMGIPVAISIERLASARPLFIVKRTRIAVASVFMLVRIGIGIDRCWNGYVLSILRNNNIRIDTQTMEAFRWISEHTTEQDVIRCTYADAGMWIPAFANRPTLGAHLHFIHEISHVEAALEERPGEKNLFVTARDVKEQTPILSLVGDKKVVFRNEAVVIYY